MRFIWARDTAAIDRPELTLIANQAYGWTAKESSKAESYSITDRKNRKLRILICQVEQSSCQMDIRILTPNSQPTSFEA
jgi:hypothetical protein